MKNFVRRQAAYSIYFTVIIGIVVTGALVFITYKDSYESVKEKNDMRAMSIKDDIARKINSIDEILYGMRALFDASNEVDSDEYRLFSENLLARHPYVSTSLYLKKVKLKERAAFEETMQDNGYLNFFITEKTNDKFIVSTTKKQYFPLIYIEPFTPLDIKYLGFNYLSDGLFRPAINQAIDLAKPSVSKSMSNGNYLVFMANYAGKRIPTMVEERRKTVVGIIALHVNAEKMIVFSSPYEIILELEGVKNEKNVTLFHQEKTMFSDRRQVNELEYQTIINSDAGDFKITIKMHLWWNEFDMTLIFGAVLVGALITFLIAFQVRSILNSNNTLYQHNIEINSMVVDLALAKKEADNSNRLKSEFLANMSHELRTPVHAMMGFCELGSISLEDWNHEEQLENFDEIRESGDRLLGLINNLLDLSKLESKVVDYEFQEVDFMDIVNSAVKSLKPIIDKKSQLVNTRIFSCCIECDRGKIHQVIINFLSNAIKFSLNGKTIDLSMDFIAASSQQPAMISFSVVDHGMGIPSEELNSVFDKFIQSSKTKTKAGGTGLGLAISKEIIAGHKGKIWAENMPDGGSKFSFNLPLKRRLI